MPKAPRAERPAAPSPPPRDPPPTGEPDRFFELSLDLCCVVDADGTMRRVNPAWEWTLGWSAEELVGTPVAGLIAEGDRAAFVAAMGHAAHGAGLAAHVARTRLRGGGTRWLEWSATPPDGAGRLIYIIARDITPQREAEERIRADAGLWQTLLRTIPDTVFFKDLDGRFTQVNQAQAAVLGLADPALAVGRTDADFFSAEHAAATHAEEARIIATGEPLLAKIERAVMRDGAVRWFTVTKVPLRNAAGAAIGTFGTAREITDLMRSEEALRASESRYRLLFARNLAGVYRSTLDGRILECNEAFARIFGYASPAEASAQPSAAYHLDPPGRDAFLERIRESGSVINLEWPHRRKDGGTVWVIENAAFVPGDVEGTVCIEGTVVDVTDRRRLEAQLRQSQKMEAVGQLAGGIAHDFNNLLTAILGFSALLLQSTPAVDPRRRDLEEIRTAATRAATLTQQLLAFSRRQVLQPLVLDLGAVIAAMETMLRRLIGEHIELATDVPAELWPVLADQGQVEQVIVNLAVNARDAMPAGGRLTIGAANVHVDGAAAAAAQADAAPGAYVVLDVHDTGTGMSPEVRARIFEPFFTTKGPGVGTGLGLATVYGVVKQSGGFITVQSEPGRGTRFRVHLPRAAAGRRHSPPPVAGAPRGGEETVLVVEDEPMVRSLARSALQSHGYRVLDAGSGREALDVARRFGGEIALLLTDVVMPGMNGRELAEALLRERPGTRVLYSSGYTDDAIVRHGLTDTGLAFLQKPYTPDGLLRAVRGALDGTAAR